MATKRKTRTNAEKEKRKAKFQQSSKQTKNVINKMQSAYNAQMQERQDMIRRATIVDAIYEARPELSTVIDGKLQLNMENVYLNPDDNILYWKADSNPIVSGLDSFDKYVLYSIDFFNGVLDFIGNHKNQTATQTDVDLGDFDLVEDTEDGTIEIDAEVVNTTTDSNN